MAFEMRDGAAKSPRPRRVVTHIEQNRRPAAARLDHLQPRRPNRPVDAFFYVSRGDIVTDTVLIPQPLRSPAPGCAADAPRPRANRSPSSRPTRSGNSDCADARRNLCKLRDHAGWECTPPHSRRGHGARSLSLPGRLLASGCWGTVTITPLGRRMPAFSRAIS